MTRNTGKVKRYESARCKGMLGGLATALDVIREAGSLRAAAHRIEELYDLLDGRDERVPEALDRNLPT